MRNLINFIIDHYHWALFLLLEVIGLTLFFSRDGYQRASFISSTNTIVGWIYEGRSKVTTFFDLTQTNRELTSANVYLNLRVKQLQDELEKYKDSGTTRSDSVNPLAGYKLIPAKVVHNSLHLKDNLLTIDKGTADGVDKDMGVVSGNGVVGIVYKAGPHYSVVIPVLNSQSSISCMIEHRRYFGYLHWTGGASNMAYVDDVPRHAHFKLYERMVTSGYSTVFPEGVPVGKIIHVFNSPDGVSYRIQVHLYTNFATLRDVMVIDNEKVTEQVELLRHAADTLALTNR
ncbi:MAG: rod shape-determining protein MreC [Prevotella sp.]|nr:rod shape-determining protein MreC [Prevotella sp.]